MGIVREAARARRGDQGAARRPLERQATLLQASDSDLTIQPKTRVAVGVRNVDYASLASLELEGEKGRGVAKAVGIGVASGVAAFVGMLPVMVASLD